MKLTEHKRGVVKDKDERAENEAITKVAYNPCSEKLTVSAKGVAIGAETQRRVRPRERRLVPL